MSGEITEDDYAAAAKRLRCAVPAIKALAEVESPKGPFFPDRSPTSLFEAHWFHKLTKGVYHRTHPTISQPNWEQARKYYRADWQGEVVRREMAAKLNREAALRSASWGRFQIMGFNHAECGFAKVQGFIGAMFESELAHLNCFVEFVLSKQIDDELRNGDLRGFVRIYNGTGQIDYYVPRLLKAFQKHGGVSWGQ